MHPPKKINYFWVCFNILRDFKQKTETKCYLIDQRCAEPEKNHLEQKSDQPVNHLMIDVKDEKNQENQLYVVVIMLMLALNCLS